MLEYKRVNQHLKISLTTKYTTEHNSDDIVYAQYESIELTEIVK